MRRPLKPVIAAAAMLSLVASSSPALAAPVCIARAELQPLVRYALPSVIEGGRQRCQATLPRDAFLRTDAIAMVQRYRNDSLAVWPAAKAAFLRISAAGKDADMLIAAMPDAAMQSTVDTLVQGLVVAQLPSNRCDEIDRLARDVAPLPARNTADLITLFIELYARGKGGKLGPFTICPGG